MPEGHSSNDPSGRIGQLPGALVEIVSGHIPPAFSLCSSLPPAPLQRGGSLKNIAHPKFRPSITFWRTQPWTQTIEGLENGPEDVYL